MAETSEYDHGDAEVFRGKKLVPLSFKMSRSNSLQKLNQQYLKTLEKSNQLLEKMSRRQIEE